MKFSFRVSASRQLNSGPGTFVIRSKSKHRYNEKNKNVMYISGLSLAWITRIKLLAYLKKKKLFFYNWIFKKLTALNDDQGISLVNFVRKC